MNRWAYNAPLAPVMAVTISMCRDSIRAREGRAGVSGGLKASYPLSLWERAGVRACFDSFTFE
jgi:hypothetical protein